MNRTLFAACGVTLALGLFFVFVWAPQPWGWEGFDHYHQLALVIAEGKPFPTLEVPWGYAYFLAAFYRAFGDHPSIPLVAQAVLNAGVPLLVFVTARRLFDNQIATIAAVLTSLFSFNTVYASTQASDAVCTVIFTAAVAAFVRGRHDRRWWWFALAGALAGLAPQFRPNLILIPLVLAGFVLVERRGRRAALEAIVLIGSSAAMLMPWVTRNYRLTHEILPTSVHGGVQLWYGTLQVGPYLNSRAHNPRSVFDGPAFEYTSLTDVPLVVTAEMNPCQPSTSVLTTLRYWTDRDPIRRGLTSAAPGSHFTADVPASKGPLVLYYYFESTCREEGRLRTSQMPELGDRAPFVFFVSRDHLGDLDVHSDLLDIFDVIRLVRHAAWGEPLPNADRLSASGIADVESAVEALTPIPAGGFVPAARAWLVIEHARATLVLPDGSSIVVPRDWHGLITDVTFSEGLALALMHSTASFAELRLVHASGRKVPPRTGRDDVAINRVFYRWEPHMMRRYAALAFDNIRREPLGFAVACLYRSVRLFVIQGTDDHHTAQQFERSRLIYTAATVVSSVYLLVFVTGAVLAWRRGYDCLLPLALILYVPATLAPVLTNMRYTVTMQPLIFMFVAVAVTALWERRRRRPAAAEEYEPAGNRTARRL